MGALDKPISKIDAVDIKQLCIEQRAEGAEFEIKRGLPTKDGKIAAYTATIPDYARNALAAEIVAFANTYGGTMVVGIAETTDKLNRAKSVSPLPQCRDLARRLRQAVQDVVDPPLTLFESEGIATEADGTSGVTL